MTTGISSCDHPIKRLRAIKVYDEPDNPWVRMYFDEVMFPNGKRGRYNRIIDGKEGAGPGVVVVPVLADGRILFIRTYRYPVSRWLVELPRGFGEVGADAYSAAARELSEETGYYSNHLTDTGIIYPNSGLSQTAVHVVVATGLSHEGQPDWDSEVIERVIPLQPVEIADAIKKGEVADAISIAALYFAQVMTE